MAVDTENTNNQEQRRIRDQPKTTDAHNKNPFAPFKDGNEYFDQLTTPEKLRMYRAERFEGETSAYFIPKDDEDSKPMEPYLNTARIPYFHPKNTIADLDWHEWMQYGKPTTMQIYEKVPPYPKAVMKRILETDPWARTWIEPDFMMGEGHYFIMIKQTDPAILHDYFPVEYYIHPDELEELQPRIDTRRRRGLIRELFELRDLKTAPCKPFEHWSSLGKNFEAKRNNKYIIA